MPVHKKHSNFIVHTQEPLNGGMPLPLLSEHVVTPTERFFVRNHGTIPHIDPERYRLVIDGQVQQPLQLSLSDLLQQFEQITRQATIACAGNRRTELSDVEPIPNELPWGAEAIGNARWTGVRLRDVLQAAHVDQQAQHVACAGLDQVERHGNTFGFGGSIPLGKALRDDVLLAHTMNDSPLTPEHGFPLRLIVPGYVGARSVKWLGTITVQAEPSANYFQQRAYRLFVPHDRSETVQWESGLMLSELGINAVICEPQPHAVLPAGLTHVRGYALAGGDHTVARVELSIDGGATWMQAQLEGNEQPGTWRLWQAQLALPPGEHEIIVRATDSGAHTQPADVGDVWNFKGYMNNAWHRVRVRVSR